MVHVNWQMCIFTELHKFPYTANDQTWVFASLRFILPVIKLQKFHMQYWTMLIVNNSTMLVL